MIDRPIGAERIPADWSWEEAARRGTVSTKDVAIRFSVSEAHIRNEIKRGRLKSFRLGRRVLISVEDVMAYEEMLKAQK